MGINPHLYGGINPQMGSMSVKEIVVKKNEVKRIADGDLVLFVSTCPICYRKFVHDSEMRAIQALKLHLARKHGVSVVIQG